MIDHPITDDVIDSVIANKELRSQEQIEYYLAYLDKQNDELYKRYLKNENKMALLESGNYLK